MLLQGKRALITGGTAGIGRAIAAAFVHAGARVVIAGRDQARGEAVARDLGNATFVRADVSSLAAVRRLAAAAIAESLAARPQLLTRYLALTVRQRLSRQMAEGTALGMALEGLTAANLAYR